MRARPAWRRSGRLLHWSILLLVAVRGNAAAGADEAAHFRNREVHAEVVIYGATAGGVAAALQAARLGHSVMLVEPGEHVGGLTSGGLGATDIGNKAAVGGISREFYERIGDYYGDESAWSHERAGDYRSPRGDAPGSGAMWTFEPHVAEQVLRDMLAEDEVPLLLRSPIDRKRAARMSAGQLQAVWLRDGRLVRGDYWIDATYEGDLLALAGVSYTVGREAASLYNEDCNGVRRALNTKNHRFVVDVDPYRIAGRPDSGLLPGVVSSLPPDGESDRGVQAYCFRMCTTDVRENQAEWVRPEDYDPEQYELLLRNFEAGDHSVPWHHVMMPNRKTDTNNNRAVSTDFIGMNHSWPEASDKQRAEIYQQHLSYQQGLMWTLANSPRVPASVQKVFQTWKPAADEFVHTEHWPHQLYVREGRRLVSDYVMTQDNCLGRSVSEDSVGLAAYTMDSHNVWRYVTDDGYVQNEGDVQVGGFSPYPISYRALIPRRSECRNLLVPICLSASHIAYGSIRMEPVFMVLGQSAAIAACQAADEQLDVQDVRYTELQQVLLKNGQRLSWPAESRDGGR